MNYSDATLDEASQGLDRLYTALKDYQENMGSILTNWVDQFDAAMNDDFNTPEAIAVLFGLSTEANKARQQNDTTAYHDFAKTLKYLASHLGLLQKSAVDFLQSGELQITEQEIQALIDERKVAKQNKDFSRADVIRKELLDMGIILEDQPKGETTWRKS